MHVKTHLRNEKYFVFRAVFLQLNILYILPVIVLIFGNHFPFCFLKSRGLLVY